jgi:hypothetical protein
MGQQLTRFLNLYAGTGSGLLGNLFVVFVMLGLWGVGTYALLEYLMTDEDVERVQEGATFLAFIIGIVFWRWLAMAFESYNDEAIALRRLLTGISNMSSAAASFMNGGNKETSIWFEALAFYSFRLYIDHDSSGHYEHWNSIEDTLPDKRHRFVTERDRTHFLSRSLLKHLTTLREKGALPEHSFDLLYQLWMPINDNILSADVTLSLPEAPFLHHWLVLVIFLHVIFVSPFEMFVRVRFWMVFVYPPTMLLVTGFYFIRQWLGNRLDKKNPLGTRVFFEWREKICRDIREHHLTSLSRKESE